MYMEASILVQISDFEWTMRAMHLACAISRNTHSGLVLLQLRQVANPALLGSGLGVDLPSLREHEELCEYSAVAEDYGIEFTLQPMVYASQVDALVQAAAAVNASVIFAHLPGQFLPFWDRLQRWNLHRQLASQGCQLYTLEPSEQPEKWIPVSAKAAKRA
jgi:hypothetical protein